MGTAVDEFLQKQKKWKLVPLIAATGKEIKEAPAILVHRDTESFNTDRIKVEITEAN